MLKIALVGAPNSGKTELAQLLKDSLQDRKLSIVDNYIADIEQRSDNTLGHFGSYLGNIQALIGRWEAERRIIRDEDPEILITCGTTVETVVYNGVHALIENNIDGEGFTVSSLQNNKRAAVSMTLMGIINFDIWDYNYAFYLPLSEEYRIKEGSKWDSIVDDNIPEAANALNVNLIRLDEQDERLSTILQTMLAYETAPSE